MTSNDDTSEAPAPGDPLRIAAIDVGSNAIRMQIVELTGAHRYRVLAQERLPVRLGHDVFLSGSLTADAMDRAARGFRDFRRRMDDLGVEHYRAVATSAVRESGNGDAFVERVRGESDIELEVITGSEEARLVHVAVRSRVDLDDSRWILVDVGGGSVEVMLVDDSGVLWSESHTLGTVRLLEELQIAGDDPGHFASLVEEYVGSMRLDPADDSRDVRGMIATGGNIETLAELAGYAPDAAGVSRLPLESLHGSIETLARLSYDERMEQLGLRADRADVILPAAHVYARLAALAGADTIVVPHVGVKEGLLLDLAADLASHGRHESELDQATLSGALTLGRRFRFEEEHGMHVGRLAVSLFDQLRGVHELETYDRRVLLAAAVLHDVGKCISSKKHHKHSRYIIRNSEIGDFPKREMKVIAHVARYHRKAKPSTKQGKFKKLDPEDRVRVAKLAAILRLADALDREHLQRVHQVRAEVEEGELVLVLEGEGELLLERWAVERKSKLFREIFGLETRVAHAARTP